MTFARASHDDPEMTSFAPSALAYNCRHCVAGGSTAAGQRRHTWGGDPRRTRVEIGLLGRFRRWAPRQRARSAPRPRRP